MNITLHRAKYEIFQTQKENILSIFRDEHKSINLIEFGAVDGYKIKFY